LGRSPEVVFVLQPRLTQAPWQTGRLGRWLCTWLNRKDLRFAVADLRLNGTDAILSFNRKLQIENRKSEVAGLEDEGDVVRGA
jgi:hypothetical protein